jgi:hypothetical protein
MNTPPADTFQVISSHHFWCNLTLHPVYFLQVSDRASVFGRASTSAVQVLHTLSSGMSSLSPGGGFVSGPATKGNRVSILAFEVANTIVKGMSLMQSLSKENLKYLKETVLRSQGVQRLVSNDVDELMRIAAFDKRFATDALMLVSLFFVFCSLAYALTATSMFQK